MRLIRRIVLVAVILLVGPLLLAVLGTVIPFPFAQKSNEPLTRRILVVSNTIHTDIAIPVDPESLAAFAFLADTGPPIDHPEARWLLLGWGGRSFYLETPSLTDIKPGPAFRALTLDSSVMHVDVLAGINESDPAVLPLDISDADYASLLETIGAGFTRQDGKVLPIEGYAFGASDKFYEAEGHFNALLGCNVWTSRMLRSAGLTTGLWNPTPPSLTASLRLFNGSNL